MSDEENQADADMESNVNERGQESFEEMLERSFTSSGHVEPGQKIKAKVISVAGDLVYVDLGGKSDGAIDAAEFLDEEGNSRIKAGDEVEAYFISSQDGIRRFTTLVNGYSPALLHSIEDAFNAGIAVTGEVKREIKGGFEVSVGGIRCFCPFSQIDLSGGREGGIYLGQSFPFRVLEFGERGRNVIVSRRAILEEERKRKIEELRESLHSGMTVEGTVRAVHDFGAFVDLGGLDGMIPSSEMSWNRAERPRDVLSAGAKVTTRIIGLDWERNRVTLSLKALQPDPWASIQSKYPLDSRVTGTVVRLAAFGAFVSLEPGVDGLIHISNFGTGKRINHPREVVQVGQQVEAYVILVDEAQRKLSLSLQPRPKPVEVILPAVGAVLDGTVEKVMPYGLFVKIGEALSGLLPNAEMDTPPGTDHSKTFPPGTKMQVVVISVESKSGKVRLSRKGIDKTLENDEYVKFKEAARKEKESTEKLGTFGKLLKAKLEEKGLAPGDDAGE